MDEVRASAAHDRARPAPASVTRQQRRASAGIRSFFIRITRDGTQSSRRVLLPCSPPAVSETRLGTGEVNVSAVGVPNVFLVLDPQSKRRLGCLPLVMPRLVEGLVARVSRWFHAGTHTTKVANGHRGHSVASIGSGGPRLSRGRSTSAPSRCCATPRTKDHVRDGLTPSMSSRLAIGH
jgi:hypothetical protein